MNKIVIVISILISISALGAFSALNDALYKLMFYFYLIL